MKLYFFILTISIFSFFSLSAQNQNKWGIGLAINSIQAQVEIPLMTGTGALLVDADGNILTGGNRIDKSFSFSIIPKYYFNDDILLRFEVGLTNLNLKASSDSKSAITHDLSTKEVSSKILRYTGGFQWIFMKKRKIESYCGMTASYINYRDVNINRYNESRNLLNDTIQFWTKVKETTPGGFAAGIGAFAGFKIYLHKHISLGAELSSSALYYKLGGETKGENSEQVPTNPVYTYNTSFVNSYKGFKISKIISSFNISVWF